MNATLRLTGMTLQQNYKQEAHQTSGYIAINN